MEESTADLLLLTGLFSRRCGRPCTSKGVRRHPRLTYRVALFCRALRDSLSRKHISVRTHEVNNWVTVKKCSTASGISHISHSRTSAQSQQRNICTEVEEPARHKHQAKARTHNLFLLVLVDLSPFASTTTIICKIKHIVNLEPKAQSGKSMVLSDRKP